ncbi:MAG: protein kinase [Deltaproteobacteria bacterium]|nr:protein kinase [Deltaproteobacteria bacterium]
MSTTLAGRFVLERSVGRGAFAEVFLARDLHEDTEVAVKCLHPQYRDDLVVRERFLREGRLLSRVNSQHVVGFIAQGEGLGGNAPWIALEWLEGSDLATRMSHAGVTPIEAVRYAIQLAQGLAVLHRSGIVHRDIKPSNFFVHDAPTGTRVTIIDLGIARSPTEKDITLDGIRIGTPAYMSPEQARGDERLSPRSDLYSLGAVLYELLSGHKPFTASDPFAVLARVLLEAPRPLRLMCPSLSGELLAVVERAMQRDPEARYASALEMADALESIDDLPERPSMVLAGNEPATAQLRVSVVERALERRVLTTVLCDLSSVRAHEAAYENFAEIMTRHGGVPHRVAGRRALALFGAVRTAGDEPVRAGRAALELLYQLATARIAVGTTRALAGEGLLPTDAIERSAAQLARAHGSVALDEETARALGATFVVDGLEHHRILLSERASYTVIASRLLGREVPLVGRDRELAQLTDAWDRSVRAQSHGVALLLGPAGIGKSRLRVAFLRTLSERKQPLSVFAIRCDPMLQEVPFGALGRAVRHRAMVEPDDAESVRAAALARWARALHANVDPSALRVLACVDEADDLQGDPESRRDRLRVALGGLLDALARRGEGPLVLLVEDLQWLDDATVDALRFVLEAEHGGWLFVLGVGRPETLRRWPRLWEATTVANVTLGPLTDQATTELVRAALGEDASEARVQRIVARSTGIPLFVEELVRVSGSDDHELPLAIQSAFQGRLDALPQEAKRAALVASVLGVAVWPDALAHMEPGLDADTALAALTHAEVLAERRRARLGRRSEYVWRHALLRETAYAMLSPEDCAKLHLRAVEWLGRAGERDEAVLADHYLRANEGGQAVEHFLGAARKALREGAHNAVIAHAERALATHEGARETRAQLGLLAATALHRAGRYEQALSYSARGLALDPPRNIQLALTSQHALTLRRVGQIHEGMELLVVALGARAERDDAQDPATYAERLAVELECAWNDIHRLEFSRAEERANAVLTRLDHGTDAVLRFATRHALAQALQGTDQLEGSLREHRAVVEGAEQAGLLWRAIGARVGLAQVLLALGLNEAGLRELDTIAVRAVEASMPSPHAYALHYRARVRLRMRDYVQADRDAAEAIALAEKLGNPSLAASTHALRAAIAVLGQTQDSVTLPSVVKSSHLPRGWAATVLGVRAYFSIKNHEPRVARELLEEALSLIDRGGEDEGDEPALQLLLLCCEMLGEKVLAARAERGVRARLDTRLLHVHDLELRASLRAQLALALNKR